MHSDFTIHNLPFGIFSMGKKAKRAGIAYQDSIIDLSEAAKTGLFSGIDFSAKVLISPTLNAFIALGKEVTSAFRSRVQADLKKPNSILLNSQGCLVSMKKAKMHLPVEIGDYTDFYSSIEHATNVGIMFRDPANALLPNWKHIPVGYHGRASSIVVSGTPIRRPWGQVLPKGETQPVFQPSARLDFELEMGFIIGKNSELGKAIKTSEAENYIFGMVLFNDWSARDIQQWEYVPLGPFLGKNFGSTMSPWIVTMDALEPFRCAGPTQDPPVQPYLEYDGLKNYDIALEVAIQPKFGKKTVVSRSNFKYMYWNMVQQLAHHSVNGCNMRIGDLLASGTISGPTPDSYGSMLELAWAGTKPVAMEDGSTRVFIQDGDTVILSGFCEKDGVRVGFGEAAGEVLAAKK